MKINDAPWLSTVDQISTASNESLLRAILTADGKGSAFKEDVLREILVRVDPNMTFSRPIDFQSVT